MILCADCGTLIEPNDLNLCSACASVGYSIDFPTRQTVNFCKGCSRYMGNNWVFCEWESRELMALLLRKLKIKMRLIDSTFLWTEPHSKRIKLKLTFQQQLTNTIVEQVVVVEFVVCNQYCPDCTRLDAQLTWKAVVQVRQKVLHKRTFLWLEQMILKHSAHKDTSNILEFRDGLDFYYGSRNHAIKMLDFLQGIVPVRSKSSQELISSDIHGGTADFKFTYSVEIVPVCRDDLVCLPVKLARSLSNISQLALCHRVSNTITFVDPVTGSTGDLRPSQYWETPFAPIAESRDLVEFYIIDIQLEGKNGRFGIAMAEVAKSTDLSTTWFVRTHLGFILHPGDHAKGYLVANSNFNNEQFDELERKRKTQLPDIVLVRKSYPNARKKVRQRNWKLKSMVKQQDQDMRKHDDKTEHDYEHFLRDLEEDPELRGMVNLYKEAQADADEDMMDDEEGTEADFPDIDVNDLLEEMEEMQLDDDEQLADA